MNPDNPSSAAHSPENADSGAPISLSFVIPVFDEESTLGPLAARIRAVVNTLPNVNDHEIIFVDDGSRDNSWQEIRGLHASNPDHIKGFRLRRNFGKAEALAAGFRAAKGDIIFTLDADLQDDPDEIPRFIEKLGEGYDLVTGWKKDRKDPLSKRLPSKVFNWVINRIAKARIHDVNCGFKAYRREAVQDIQLYGELHRFIPILVEADGFSVAEIAVKHHPREFGVSKYGWERLVKGFLDLLTVVAITRFLNRPLHLLGGLGLLVGMVGIAILGGLSIGWLFGTPIAGRPLFFLGILAVLLSAQLVSLGIVAELIRKNNHQGATSSHIREVLR